MFDSSLFSSCLRLHLPPIIPKPPCPAEAPDCQIFLDYLLPRTFYHRSTPEARHDLEVFIGNVWLVSIGCFPLPFQPSFFPPHSTAILNSKEKTNIKPRTLVKLIFIANLTRAQVIQSIQLQQGWFRMGSMTGTVEKGRIWGLSQVLWNKDRGVETTRVQWLDLAWGSCS